MTIENIVGGNSGILTSNEEGDYSAMGGDAYGIKVETGQTTGFVNVSYLNYFLYILFEKNNL